MLKYIRRTLWDLLCLAAFMIAGQAIIAEFRGTEVFTPTFLTVLPTFTIAHAVFGIVRAYIQNDEDKKQRRRELAIAQRQAAKDATDKDSA